jgi:hypothetical protein
MPVLIVFKYGSYLTLAVINRRLHKKDDRKDVLEKVSLIKDIRIDQPHRAHIDILFDLSFPELQRKFQCRTFVELHDAWRKTLDTKELNKNFFTYIFNWYLWASQHCKFPQIRPQEDMLEDRTHQNESLIRLMTRLLFCWFMKEKGLIPQDLFLPDRLPSILKTFNPTGEETIYYRAILQNLFFATLNRPVKDRKIIAQRFPNPEYGDPLVYRYAELFVDQSKILNHFSGIPFLNGGLFDCLDTPKNRNNPSEIRLDGFSSKKNKQPIVPDKLFFGEHKHIDLSLDYDDKAKNNLTVFGLIDILDKYKFTVEENTPFEEEVALDPELLGKVFENLLASYNPETRNTARKATGSFYTPREIVDYMVDESLLAYLAPRLVHKGEIENVEQRLRTLLSADEALPEPPFTQDEIKTILHAMNTCRILDPACGSGAFPMGMLQKMIHILRKIDPENRQWFEMVIANFPAYLRNDMRIKLQKEKWDYVRKLGIIQECIYGVDIQPIAIQIAKLRFFISLLVDQEDKPAESNRGFESLPNLDFKLVAADMLIAPPESEISDIGFLTSAVDPFFEKFAELTDRYFTVQRPEEKLELRHLIEEVISEKCAEKIKGIEKALRNIDDRYRHAVRDKHQAVERQREDEIRLWASFKNLFKNEAVGFFEPKYFFPSAAAGFDIVLGNPPYVQIQNFSGLQKQKDWEKQKYETFAKTGDMYCLFYERGHRLLKDSGVLTFISSNKWMRASYGKLLRKFIASHADPIKLIDFDNVQIFENTTVNTNILIFTKSVNRHATLGVSMQNVAANQMDIADFFQKHSVMLRSLGEESWLISSNEEHEIKSRIEEIGKPLKKWDIAINYGIKTGYNEAFIVEGKKKNELVKKDPNSEQILKPILRGRDIKRYRFEYADLWLILAEYGSHEYLQKQYRIIYNHLAQYKAELLNRGQCRYTSSGKVNTKKQYPGQHHWLELDNNPRPDYINEFLKPKIAWGNLSISAQFSYCPEGIFVSAPSPMITPGNKYLLAILNSQVADYYIRSLGVTRNGGYFEYKPMFVEQLPVPEISKEKQAHYEILVDCILYARENNMLQESLLLESVVDGLVYDLYFTKEMQAAHCYITDWVTDVLKPFRQDDSDAFKSEYVKSFCAYCSSDRDLYHGLIHRRTIKQVQIISGARNER